MPTPREPETFLAGLYLDHFDRSLFSSFSTPATAPETAGIIAGFSELSKDYLAAELEKAGTLPDQLWLGLKKLGIFGLNIPKEYGGQGLSLTQYLLVLQTLAGFDLALALIPTAHLSIGVKGIILFGTEDQKKRYLPRAACGEMIFAYALTEPEIGSDAQHITTTATLSADGQSYILKGHKSYITNGGYAGGLTVFAQMDPERPGFMGAFIVETANPGVKIGRSLPKMGLAVSSTTTITLDEVRVPRENLLGAPGDGFKIAMSILNYGRLGLGAASAGVMARAVTDMRQRSGSRIQFGKPIAEFELIREKMVRARVHGAVAEAMTAFTAHLLELAPTANLSIESSHTKLFGTTRAWDCLYEAMQTAGGAGYLATLPYEKRLRDFRVTTIFEGTSEIHTIYPPLYLLRLLTGEGRDEERGGISRLLGLVRKLLRYPCLNLHFQEPEMNRAVARISRAVWRIKLMLGWGLLRHGHRLPDRELYLGRITGISLYLYGTLCLLAAINSHRAQGEVRCRELRLLDYFLDEFEVVCRNGGRLRLNRRERLLSLIFSDLDQGEN
jgi:acyl-CoA dehydrogenase family protein 9